jgi:hypothetical protein
MRYNITGADKESGNDVNVVVNAITRIEAEHIAHTRGILVSAITALDKEPDDGPLTLDGDPFEDTSAPAAATAVATVAAPTATHAAPADPAHPAAAVPHAEAPHAEFSATSKQTFGASGHQGDHTEYKIMNNPSLMLLNIAVNTMLRDDWEVCGGLATCIINNAPNFFQVLIKHPRKKAAENPPAH